MPGNRVDSSVDRLEVVPRTEETGCIDAAQTCVLGASFNDEQGCRNVLSSAYSTVNTYQRVCYKKEVEFAVDFRQLPTQLVRLGPDAVIESFVVDEAVDPGLNCPSMWYSRSITTECLRRAHLTVMKVREPRPLVVNQTAWASQPATAPWPQGKNSLSTHCYGKVVEIENLFGVNKASIALRHPPSASEVHIQLGASSAVLLLEDLNGVFEQIPHTEDEPNVFPGPGDFFAQTFLPHYNAALGTVVFEIPTGPDDERRFLTYDPFVDHLVATKTISECSMFQFTARSKGIVETVLQKFEAAQTASAFDQLAAEDVVQAVLPVIEAYCPKDTVAEATAAAFCSMGLLWDSRRLVLTQTHIASGTQLVDITASQNTKLSVFIPQLADLANTESAIQGSTFSVLQVLGQILEGQGNIAELVGTVSSQVATVSDNMKTIQGLWVAAREDTLGFESDLAQADITVNWGVARSRLDSVGDELAGAQTSLNLILGALNVVVATNFLGRLASMFFDPTAFFDVVKEESDLVNLNFLGADAKKALQDVLDLVPKMQAVLRNIERLDSSLRQLVTLSSSRVDQFLEAYTDFNGGDSAAVDAAFGKLEIFVDGLCSINAFAAARCAELLVQVNTAKTFAVAGIDAAWAAADDMGRKARAEYERLRLDQLRNEVGALPDASPIADGSVEDVQKKARSYRMRVMSLDATYRATVVHQGAVRFEFATAFCAAQQYNFAGLVSNACSDLFENGVIPSYAKLTEIPSSSTPGTTRTFETMTAGIPTFPDELLAGEQTGYINLTALATEGTWTMRIPRNTAWLRKYEWIGPFFEADEVAIFTNSLRIHVPTGPAGGVGVRIDVENGVVQPVVVQGQGERRFKIEPSKTAFSYQSCRSASAADANPYSACSTDLLPVCVDVKTGREPFAVGAQLRQDAVLPSLYSEYTLRVQHADAAVLRSISAMVVKVNVDGVRLLKDSAARLAPSVSLAAPATCCASGFMGEWHSLVSVCTSCPLGSVAVHRGVYCEHRRVYIKFVGKSTYLRDTGSSVSTKKTANSDAFLWEVEQPAAGLFSFKNVKTGQYLRANGNRCGPTANTADDAKWLKEDGNGFVLFRNFEEGTCCVVSTASDTSVQAKAGCGSNSRIVIEHEA